MSQLLLATSRLMFEWVVRGLAHKYNAYMAYNDVLGQHQMVDRDGITTILWTLGAQALWTHIAGMYNSTDVATPASVTLQHRSGIIWNTVDVAALTGAGASPTATTPAQQITVVARDTSFYKLRLTFLETIEPYAGHWPNGHTSYAALDNTLDGYTGVNVGVNEAFRWQKSRGDRFLAPSGTIAGITFDLNDKLKRARGLA